LPDGALPGTLAPRSCSVEDHAIQFSLPHARRLPAALIELGLLATILAVPGYFRAAVRMNESEPLISVNFAFDVPTDNDALCLIETKR